ncbi:MAG: hypothetical protein LBD07_02990 [Spirochaetaceae bacterium]|jgi:chromosome segregation ATPase|nr:hypothetical protein [Spirochaetaceae bacterium]
MLSQNTDEIVFDTASGVSIEEQKDIVKQIEQITRSSGNGTVLKRINASKKGYVFPLAINCAALVFVMVGFSLVFAFKDLPAEQHFSGVQELNSAEGKLIQEIRRQSSIRMGEKEMEIASISAKIDERVKERDDITAELTMQPEREKELRPRIEALEIEIDELNGTLAELQRERQSLVTVNRNQEDEIFASRLSNEEASMFEKLRGLNSDEERYAFFTRQIEAYYRKIEIEVQQGKVDAAKNTLADLRVFVSSPAFLNVPLIKSQYVLNAAAIDTLDHVIGIATGDTFAKAEKEWLAEKAENNRVIANLEWQNARLEKEVAFLQPDVQRAELQKRDAEIATLKTVVSEHETAIAKRDVTITAHSAALTELRKTIQHQEGVISEREATISELKTQFVSLNQTLSERDRVIRECQAEIENQKTAIKERNATITAMREQNTKDQQTIMERERTISELRSESATQRQTIAERDRTISQNRTQITIQQQQINERDRNIAELRTQAANQQQTVTEMEQVVEDLRSQTTGGHQAVTDRERLIAELRTQVAAKERTVAERDAAIAGLNTKNTTLSQTIAERDRTINQMQIQIQNQQQTIAERDKSIQLLMGEIR